MSGASRLHRWTTPWSLRCCQRRDQALEVCGTVGIDSEFVIGDSVVDRAREDQSAAVSFGLQELLNRVPVP